MWSREQLVVMASSKTFAVVAASATSGVVGAVASHLLTKSSLETKLSRKYSQYADEEIVKAQEYYKQLYKAEEYADIDNLVSDEEIEELKEETDKLKANAKKLVERLDIPQASHTEQDVTEEVEQAKAEPDADVVNIFTQRDAPLSDLQKFFQERDEDEPYILTHEEYFGSDTDYPQKALTYWAEDEVLADEKGPISDKSLVGEDNLDKFGLWSKNPKFLYVRNEEHEVEFEISLSQGSFAREVLGFDDREIKHSDRRGRRHRWDDDGE